MPFRPVGGGRDVIEYLLNRSIDCDSCMDVGRVVETEDYKKNNERESRDHGSSAAYP